MATKQQVAGTFSPSNLPLALAHLQQSSLSRPVQALFNLAVTVAVHWIMDHSGCIGSGTDLETEEMSSASSALFIVLNDLGMCMYLPQFCLSLLLSPVSQYLLSFSSIHQHRTFSTSHMSDVENLLFAATCLLSYIPMPWYTQSNSLCALNVISSTAPLAAPQQLLHISIADHLKYFANKGPWPADFHLGDAPPKSEGFSHINSGSQSDICTFFHPENAAVEGEVGPSAVSVEAEEATSEEERLAHPIIEYKWQLWSKLGFQKPPKIILMIYDGHLKEKALRRLHCIVHCKMDLTSNTIEAEAQLFHYMETFFRCLSTSHHCRQIPFSRCFLVSPAHIIVMEVWNPRSSDRPIHVRKTLPIPLDDKGLSFLRSAICNPHYNVLGTCPPFSGFSLRPLLTALTETHPSPLQGLTRQ